MDGRLLFVTIYQTRSTRKPETFLKHTFRFAQKEKGLSRCQKQKSKPMQAGTETNPLQDDCLSNQVVWGLAPTEITDNEVATPASKQDLRRAESLQRGRQEKNNHLLKSRRQGHASEPQVKGNKVVFLVIFKTLYLGFGFKHIASEQHGCPKPGNYKSLSRRGAFLVAQMVKNLSAIQEPGVWSMGQDDPLETGRATHSSILAWRIPWIEKPRGQQSMGRRELDTTEVT